MLLFLLFLGVPALELFLLIRIGQEAGTLTALGLIVFTAIAGAHLARQQGLAVLGRLRAQVARGELPTDALLDGALVVAAGALLLTPGVITDFVGLLCLFPPTRALIKPLVLRKLREGVARGTVRVHMDVNIDTPPGRGAGPAHAEEDIIDVEPVREERLP